MYYDNTNKYNITGHKVFIFDIDGTLIGSGDDINIDVIKRIEILKNIGYIIGLATGRSLMECYKIIEQIKPDLPIICQDGQVIYDIKNDEVIFKQALDYLRILELKMHFGKKLYFIEENEFKVFVEDEISRMMFSMAFNINRRYVQRKGKMDFSYPVRIYLRTKKNDDTISEGEEKVIKELLGKNISVYRAGDKWLVLRATAADKLTGIDLLCKRYRITMDDIVSFGDGENDINLLKASGLSIAMANAKPEVKKHADLIADHVDKGGIINILDCFINKQVFDSSIYGNE